MRVAVCVKRVPAPGATIVLAADGRSIDARMLSFTTSPHEECAVEEAIRLVEKHGGSSTVLTVGQPESEEQLRYAMSLGVDKAVLVPTDGSEWDAQATAAALTATIRFLEEGGQVFDLILFGNESADAGNYQVGIRLARTLGRPVVTGIKAIEIADEAAVVRRATSGGSEIYRLPLPAVVAVKEGINLPRYPTMPGRLRSKKAEIVRREADARPGGLEMLRFLNPPQQASQTLILGRGPEAAPAVVDLFAEMGLL
jgi:electron transfer flavoprotein beta subunit